MYMQGIFLVTLHNAQSTYTAGHIEHISRMLNREKTFNILLYANLREPFEHTCKSRMPT